MACSAQCCGARESDRERRAGLPERHRRASHQLAQGLCDRVNFCSHQHRQRADNRHHLGLLVASDGLLRSLRQGRHRANHPFAAAGLLQGRRRRGHGSIDGAHRRDLQWAAKGGEPLRAAGDFRRKHWAARWVGRRLVLWHRQACQLVFRFHRFLHGCLCCDRPLSAGMLGERLAVRRVRHRWHGIGEPLRDDAGLRCHAELAARVRGRDGLGAGRGVEVLRVVGRRPR
mmetsp:Transcript_35688/g.115698  ORF Transcript_35688/g.115698 Transcript_35688/m.115698 type:complete len:229 (+) Transcript_35688:704-1390(+)